MIVDDDPDVLQIIISTLRGRYGFDVTAFTNPAEALHELQRSYHMPEKKPYRVVVSDVRMPQMSGFELAARIKKIDPNLTVILMTAFEIQEQELSKGTPILPYEEILAKPFSLRKLCEYIKKHLSRGST
jgi:CheY-like chemotaxis protein